MDLEYYENKKYDNLVDKAYDILEEMIITLELKPGKTYSEIELSEMINIGRTPVKTAIKKLEATHMLEIIPRNGIYILPIRFEECSLQAEVRILLEKLVAIRAAKFSTPLEREEFLNLAKRYEISSKNDDALNSVRIDNEFNHFAADCARNIFAKTALMPLQPLARRLYFSQYHTNKNLIHKINELHIETMKAIAAGDEKKINKIVENLMLNIKNLSSSTDTLLYSNN